MEPEVYSLHTRRHTQVFPSLIISSADSPYRTVGGRQSPPYIWTLTTNQNLDSYYLHVCVRRKVGAESGTDLLIRPPLNYPQGGVDPRRALLPACCAAVAELWQCLRIDSAARANYASGAAVGRAVVSLSVTRPRGPFVAINCNGTIPHHSPKPANHLSLTERRVKCPGERPVCTRCTRLGLACRYGLRLIWQNERDHGSQAEWALCCLPTQLGGPHPEEKRPTYDIRIEDWLFVSTTYADFESPELDHIRHQYAHVDFPQPPSSVRIGRPKPSPQEVLRRSSTLKLSLLVQPPFIQSPDEAYLWNYFDKFITPMCALNHGVNPYRDIILRVAASCPTASLYQCIMAVSAKQMEILGHQMPSPPGSVRSYRNDALASLRMQIQIQEEPSSCNAEMQQIVASSLMMCFFEILDNCSDAWKIHSDFIRLFIKANMHILKNSRNSGRSEYEALCGFIAAYFYSHDVLAGTLCPGQIIPTDDSLKPLLDESFTQTLTGFSTELLGILSDINNLGQWQRSTTQNGSELSLVVKQRRDDIERRLVGLGHNFHWKGEAAGSPDEITDMDYVIEMKRLASLLYFYARIDNANPSQPHMIRLTSQILDLMPQISLRTNTVLWPLTVVGIFGVRAESEDDRRFVLEKLNSLQQTRQLANVIKSRYIIKDIWKSRDLASTEALKGWSILEGRRNSISLA